MQSMKHPLMFLTLLGSFGLTNLQADIPVWRGNHNGTFEVTSAPIDWSKEQVWEIPLDTKSNGTPILVGNRLIFTAEPDKLICADSQSGQILWQQSNDLFTLHNIDSAKKAQIETHTAMIEERNLQIGKLKNEVRRLEANLKKDPDNKQVAEAMAIKEGEMEGYQEEINVMRNLPFYKDFDMPPAHQTNGYTSYSPHFDGKRIYAQFGFGVVAAYDLDGKRLWTSFLENPDHNWGGATMPQIIDGKLIIRFDDYHALDPSNGKKLWSTESEVVFGTPVPFTVEGKHFAFTPRGEVIRISDGKVLQKGLVKINTDRAWAIFNTPALVDNIIYAANGVGKEEGHAYAYRIPSTVASLNKKGLELVWHTEVSKDRYYSSPLIHDGLVYLVGQESVITALEAKTGDLVYEQKIQGVSGTAYPTMVLADNKIYQGTEDGDMVIFEPGRTFKEITRNKLGPYRSTPLFINKVAYLRTYERLIAVGSL